MSLSVDVNRAVLCRGCRKTSEETSQMIFLFNHFDAEDKKSVEFNTIYDLFSKYTLLEIDETDQNTSYICTECYQQLSDFHDFRRICIASHLEFLRQKSSMFDADQLSPVRLNVHSMSAGQTKQTKRTRSYVAVKQEKENLINIHRDDDDDDDDDVMDVALSKFVQTDLVTESSDDDSDAERDDDFHNSDGCSGELNDMDEKNKKKLFEQSMLNDSNDLTTLKEMLCDACGKVFTDPKSYEKHIQTHNSDLKLFPCDKCEKEYTTRGNLKLHMELKHPTDDNRLSKLTCHICNKVLCYEANLKQHLLRHEGKREHVCPICGDKRTTKAELKRHVNRHTKEREYPCEICSRVFYGCYDLSRHKKVVHQGIKNYKCSYCEKTFGLLSTLTSHVKIHTGEKDFECDVCHKRFARINQVKTHIQNMHALK